MSLSLSTIGAAVGAAKIAQQVGQGIVRHIGQGVSEAIGFHDALKGSDEQAVPTRADSIGTDSPLPDSIGKLPSAQTLTDAIARRLTTLGIDVNQDLAIDVSEEGQIRVLGEHLQAAEIESILNSDPQIRQIATQVARTDTANGLTIRTNQENIRSSPGGYPNW